MKKLTTQDFISKSRKVHKNKYSYKDCNYINQKTKVTLICRLHGEFTQTPKQHLQGKGCVQCGIITASSKNKQSTQDFIKKALSIHNNLYDYSTTVYIDSNTKLKIICELHGEFLQFPYNHLQGHECNFCAAEKKRENSTGWTVSSWTNSAKNSKYFDIFKVYILKLSNPNETFYKIGRTYRKTSARISDIPYDCEVIHTISKKDPKFIFDLEHELKRNYKLYKYIPKIIFNGMQECFNISLPIKDIITQYSN